MNKSRKNNKNNKNNHNKTKKHHHITFFEKKKFIYSIINEWKKQTNGSYSIDKNTAYKYDYYLSFNKKGDYYNHIHIVLKNFPVNHNTHNNIVYVMKKYNIKTNQIEHSVVRISIFSDPYIVVRNMIKKYVKFTE